VIKYLTVPNDNSAAEWISSHLSDFSACIVTSIVPNCFEAYLRIFHPAITLDGEPVSWDEVAAAEGHQMHASAQWHSLPGVENSKNFIGSKWTGIPPQTGLRLEVLKPICALLKKYTGNDEFCFFGLWNGWPEDEYKDLWQSLRTLEEKNQPTEKDFRAPRFGLPTHAGRDYFLLHGPLGTAVEMVDIGLISTSPELIWPLNKTWFLVSDIDLDSTYVGGSNELIESLLRISEIETWRVMPSDSLTINKD